MKICPIPTCRTENPDDAKYCRGCGHDISIASKPFHEKFPEYDFVPTSIARLKSSILVSRPYKLILTATILFATFSFLSLQFYEVYESYDGTPHYSALIGDCYFGSYSGYFEDVTLGCIISSFILVVLLSLYNTLVYNRCRRKALQKKVAYIQDIKKHKGKYVFVIKNSKMGVLNTTYKSIKLPTEYDSMEWINKDRTLKVEKDRRTYEIDIEGNELR